MAKQVTLTLTLDKEKTLWWSSDGGLNWAPVGAKSPISLINSEYELRWICEDESIEDIEIKVNSGKVLEPASGGNRDQVAKLNKDSENGDRSKYSIIINGSLTFDPEVVVCKNPPCAQQL